jgi:hypothetical protein
MPVMCLSSGEVDIAGDNSLHLYAAISKLASGTAYIIVASRPHKELQDQVLVHGRRVA